MHPSQPIPGGSESSPYDFILNEPPKQKRTIVPKGSSKQQRIVLLVAGGLALLTVLILVFSLIFSSGSGGIKNFENLAIEQQEIIRVSELGQREARSSATQTFASSTLLSVTSSQQQVLAYLDTKKVELKGKELASGTNGKTDTALKTAADNGKYDEVFTELLTAQLVVYKKNLQDYYNNTSSKTQKQILQDAYNSVQGLLAKPTETQEVTP